MDINRPSSRTEVPQNEGDDADEVEEKPILINPCRVNRTNETLSTLSQLTYISNSSRTSDACQRMAKLNTAALEQAQIKQIKHGEPLPPLSPHLHPTHPIPKTQEVKQKWCLTSTETIRLIRDGEKGRGEAGMEVGEDGDYIPIATLLPPEGLLH